MKSNLCVKVFRRAGVETNGKSYLSKVFVKRGWVLVRFFTNPRRIPSMAITKQLYGAKGKATRQEPIKMMALVEIIQRIDQIRNPYFRNKIFPFVKCIIPLYHR